ncbi:hypothetical protein [Cellulomonas sp. ICMP 17802]|uniref:hypothetical protein n=1 Tax=Cellulomonas sp. ICMP 17802 TaxID=3239199 RepID=UPI00351B6F48
MSEHSGTGRRRALTAVVGLVLTALAGLVSTEPTSAAWTNDVHVTAVATTATWSTGTTSCTVVHLVGTVETVTAGATCAVSGVKMQAAGWWGTAPSRQTNLDITFTSTGAAYPDYFRFTVDLSTTPGLPNGWVWSTSGTGVGNLVVRSACSALPSLTATSPTTWGPPTTLYTPLYENRAGNTASCL